MKTFYAYIRVSTARQGQHGVSLQEQRDAIRRFAEKAGLTISRWFEERETAAKRGRPIFTEMLRLLRAKKVDGVVIHKIDRSARNLKDWAELGELIDKQIDVRFVSESLDLASTGGRLAADVQAVVAAHYVRNLREETLKGFYGRLKQGLYPLGAPIGYLNCGGGKPKAIDPVRGPLVRTAFELYASGEYSLEHLQEEMARRGLTNSNGGVVTFKRLSQILRNPFYIGLMHLRKTGETFQGVHPPLISTRLFDDVRQILSGRLVRRMQRHAFKFRRFWKCGVCGLSLIGSRHKGRVYYRCQTRSCPTTSVREDRLEAMVLQTLARCDFSPEEWAHVRAEAARLTGTWDDEEAAQKNALRLALSRIDGRLDRLTDAYLEGVLDRTALERKKSALLMERAQVEERLRAVDANLGTLGQDLQEFLELVGSLSIQYEVLPGDRGRLLLEDVTSNRAVAGKEAVLTLARPFLDVARRLEMSSSSPERRTPRTWELLLPILIDWFRTNPGFHERSTSYRSSQNTKDAPNRNRGGLLRQETAA